MDRLLWVARDDMCSCLKMMSLRYNHFLMLHDRVIIHVSMSIVMSMIKSMPVIHDVVHSVRTIVVHDVVHSMRTIVDCVVISIPVHILIGYMMI